MMPRSLHSKILFSLDLRPALALLWRSGPRRVVAIGILTLLQGLLPLASLYLLKLIVDAVEVGVRAGSPLEQTLPEVLWLVAAAAGVALLGALLQSATSYLGEVQGHHVADHVLSRLHAQSTRVDPAFFEDPSYHDTFHLARQQALHRPQRILESITQIVQNTVSLVAMGGLLLLLHWALPLALFLASLPGLLVRLRHTETLYRWHVEQAPEERRARYFSHVLTHADHAEELRLFGLAGLFRDRFEAVRGVLRDQLSRLALRRSLAELTAQAGGLLALFGALAFIARETLVGALSLGDLVLYFQAFQRGQGFLQALLRHLAELYANNLFLESFHRFLALEPRIVRPPEPRTVPRPLRHGITFEKVGFRYPGTERAALEGVDLHIAPGETLALVGANGAGKSTLVKLLCRLYDPTSGRVMVDGIDLRDLDPEAWRRQIGVVFQDYASYHLSARENLWLGDVEQPLDSPEIEAVARQVGIDALLRALPAGYDQPLGKWFEGGEALSVGQWQKVALARAFLRRAPITLLDEPTSALDALSEIEVLDHLHALTRGRTSVLVSHRLSMTKRADRVVVLAEGRVVESGPPDRLLAETDGLYAHWFRAQAGPYRD